MKLGIIISQTNPETAWNAFRLANFSIKQGDEVKIFLISEGVEYEAGSSEKYNIQKQTTEFLKSNSAKILACGTCLKLRNREATNTCLMSSMKDLYELIKESDKILTF
ncbi:MAG: sulfur reduction protein DsrE [Candidatus Magasanikbacteria bacterium RIFCSPLOWO2_02_FULL_44_11]|uniref:Sulfur reduction protein DsrE n=2 Tax=Candidatus Magasanikiibacteriota TaxID=1752731 RepID=A0A1F6N913_9BACT|nr:MAG: sulfur reduction protein DsrE [Candidatus Magasanikbacteria bacterium RIFCSPHIGHO2_02_FULL_45_10]OGH80384.1 MAG: sulfur reduction protein DsrE [Candidatus Magasanikbacteria bacterium RIFCSPLOWO2_02_FULL_44_11]